MNYIQNDRGETVPAIGAPGSVARCEIQFPALISRLDAIFFDCEGMPLSQGRSIALDILDEEGITSAMERDSILRNTFWWDYEGS